MRQQIKRLVFIMAMAVMPLLASAQAEYVGEIGLRGGVSFYNGDINSSKIFRDLGPAGGAFIRFRLNKYVSLKVDGGFASIRCDARDYTENKLPEGNEFDEAGNYKYKFNKKLVNVGMDAELNFFKYEYAEHDREAKRHTPYVMFGGCMAVLTEWSGKEYRAALQFGVGYKFKIGSRVNCGVEWTIHRTFSDDLDQGTRSYLNDPYKMGKGGWSKNNDYYSMCLAFVSIDIFKKKGACRYSR